MKIALLSFEYPPETGFGGIGTYTWYHARALVRLGHEVHVLAGSTVQTALDNHQHDGVFVHRYRAGGGWMRIFRLFGVFGCHWTQRRLENAWCMYLGLKMLMREHTFDVLEMPECGAEGALVNLLVRTPKVVRFHSPSRLIMPFYDVSRMDRLLCSAIEQVAITRADALTSCSAFLAQQVRDCMGVHQPVEVIPNGIDLPLFDREPVADITRIYGLPEGRVTILFAGRMERRKGIHLCRTIAASILRDHDVAFLFAGEDLFGYMKDKLVPALAGEQLRGSFHYIGKLGPQQLRSCARAVDILLLPSLWENCPYSCLEAMASGRAIVSSDQGGMPELIEHGRNGLLASSGSPESFISSLEILIDDSALRQHLGQAARQTIEQRFTDLHVSRLTEQIYTRCQDRRRSP